MKIRARIPIIHYSTSHTTLCGRPLETVSYIKGDIGLRLVTCRSCRAIARRRRQPAPKRTSLE